MKNYPKILEAVGLNMRCARNKAKLTQQELAVQAGVSRNQISKIEQGKVKVGAETLDMICTVLRVSIKIILEPYDDERYLYKNTSQSSSPNALLRVSDSQAPQDSQELKILETKGLAGGGKSAKIRLRLIMFQICLYYTKVVMNIWKVILRCSVAGLSICAWTGAFPKLTWQKC